MSPRDCTARLPHQFPRATARDNSRPSNSALTTPTAKASPAPTVSTTLGTGTVLYAIALWYTEGRQVIGVLPPGFTAIYTTQLFRLPIVAFYVLVISLVLWVITQYLPIGRYLYAIGANPRAADLNGIPSRRYVIGAFVASGFLGAIAGVLLAARLRIGQASVGLEFLLPALVGAFLHRHGILFRHVRHSGKGW